MPTYTFEVQGGAGSGAQVVLVERTYYIPADKLIEADPLLEVVINHEYEVEFAPPAIWTQVDIEEQGAYGEWASIASGYRITELKKAAETGAVTNGKQVTLLVELVEG